MDSINTLLWIIVLLVTMFSLVLVHAYFGRVGLVGWMVLALIGANIQGSKQIVLFGMNVSMGNILYSSIYLATDALNEFYGKRRAQMAVVLSMVLTSVFMLSMVATTFFVPNEYDGGVSANISALFAPNAAVIMFTVVGLLVYTISQRVDIFVYSLLKGRGTPLWVRNNLSTALSQVLDTVFFTILVFKIIPSLISVEGVQPLPWSVLGGIIIFMYMVKVFIAIIDTPFLYMMRRVSSGATGGGAGED